MKDLIFKFLNRRLSSKEKKRFDLMLSSDAEWAEDVYSQLLLKEALSENEDNDFRRILSEVAYEYQYKEVYDKNFLQTAFAPIKEYEENLKGVTRAGEVQVFKPKFQENCTDRLHFQLEKEIPLPLLLIIENNDYDELFRKEIPARSIAFDINLPLQKGFTPGRYYWKLASKRHQIFVMGVFFIGKGLMVQH